ncbi:MAG: hypothetical protein A2932_02415 [Candidatus Spechtbacteria bacterium RIFCSPLOWO2_01_FULL_46_10]|uniref:Uncharacterized protein n=1 Tax=Candidatus Spechtbacteria bacterium RIFCSPLOWO2_01_FULL_46_10 TaxID=1802163 RepID=A0A1G2HE73_9BACT|nr:MAG: hypothetical protein A2932_02415 [Candidatus Spechtbacteria bacterium RIFCSPLOWO2_01_FULL_46_10]
MVAKTAVTTESRASVLLDELERFVERIAGRESVMSDEEKSALKHVTFGQFCACRREGLIERALEIIAPINKPYPRS